MAKHRRREGRTTPKGTRPSHLRAVRDVGPDENPIDGIIDTAARDLAAAADPFSAEAWASNLIAMFDARRIEARLARTEVPPFEEAILHRCHQRRDAAALLVASALAAVVPPPLDEVGRSVASDIGAALSGPSWLDAVGQAEASRAWIASDVFGDQDSLIVGYAVPGGTVEQAVVVLVDHNLSGQAKDAFLANDVDDVVASWTSSALPHTHIDAVAIDVALARLRDAMAAADLWNGDTDLRSGEFAENRALVWSRLRRAGHGDSTSADRRLMAQEDRDALVADFVASAGASPAVSGIAPRDLAMLAEAIVNLRCEYEGNPLRWSPTVVRILLLDLAPAKLLLPPDQADALPRVLRAFVRFAAGAGGLDPRFADETIAAIDEAEPGYRAAIDDPAEAGPAKAVLSALRARGVPLDDPDAIATALAGLGILGGPGGPRPLRVKPSDAPVDVRAEVEQSPVLTRMAALTGFFGDGRKLTQTGQPTLADARSLVTLLGTRDRIDQTIGSRTVRTTSAAELPELGFMIRWAIAAGALRKQHGKLLATAGWHKLAAKPVHRWVKAAEALPTIGPLAGYYTHARYRSGGEVLDEVMPELLHEVRSGPVPYETALDLICEEADLRYEWKSPAMQDPAARRRSLGYDLDAVLRIFGWAGVLVRVDTTTEPDRWDDTRLNEVGGKVQLTATGKWWLSALP